MKAIQTRMVWFAILIAGFCNHPLYALTIRVGDILVTDPSSQAVFHVDPATGNRTVLSSSQSSIRVGEGPGMIPDSIAVATDGSVLVTSAADDAVIRIDPVTGDRSYLSSPSHGVGSGNRILPRQIAVTPDFIYVSDSGSLRQYGRGQSIYRIDPITGDRALASSFDLGVGQGPDWAPWGIDALASGELFVTDPAGRTVFHVDAVTGDRTIISSSQGSTALGDGFAMIPDGIAIEPSGTILITFPAEDAVIRIDPATGNRELVSSFENGVGSGPPVQPRQIALAPDGTIYVTDSGILLNYGHGQALYRIDPVTGGRTILSSFDQGVGTGPDWLPFGVTVVTIPEPVSLQLWLIAGMLLAPASCRKGSNTGTRR